MKFGTFFTVSITHAFLAGGHCTDLQFEPTGRCLQLMKRYGLLLKNDEQGRLRVVAKQNEDGLFSAEGEQTMVFEFFIFLSENDFLIYTQLPPKKPGEVYLFSNQNSGGKQAQTLTPDVIQQPKTTNTKPLFGILRISMDSFVPADFTLHFEAKAIKWRYYLMADATNADLRVDGRLSELSFRATDADGSAADDHIAQSIRGRFPNHTLLIFESDKAVPFRQSGRKNIQLINGRNNVVIVDHLPNPTFTDNGIKIINTTA